MDPTPISPSPALTRTPTLAHSLGTLLVAAAILGVGYGLLHIKIELLLLASASVAGLIGAWLGLKWSDIQAGALQSILKGMPAMMIVIVVGALIGSWMAAGVIPMVIYYGLGLISAKSFLVTACASAGVVSLLTGTGYGTIGTIGVAFMGIAHGIGVPVGQAAGALVAGAYLGDKISPLAANANLAVAASQANLYDHIRHCLWTTIPALLVGALVYTLAGSAPHTQGGAVLASTAALREALSTHFTFSVWLLLPPVVTLYSMARRRPVIPGMLLSSAVAALLAISLQGLPLTGALNCLVDGYSPHTGNIGLDKLLAQGGMASMMHVTLVALCGFAFSGILQKAGLLEPALRALLSFAGTPGKLVLSTGLTCVLVEALTGSAFLCILIPGELFAPAYSRMGLAAKNLSRVIGDCGIVGVPLIPWSIAAAFMSGTLGVPVREYAPWAVFCYAGAVFTLIAGFTGISMAKEAPQGAAA